MLPDVPEYTQLKVNIPWWSDTWYFLIYAVMTILLACIFTKCDFHEWSRSFWVIATVSMVWTGLTIQSRRVLRRWAYMQLLLRYSPSNLFAASRCQEYSLATRKAIVQHLRFLGFSVQDPPR